MSKSPSKGEDSSGMQDSRMDSSSEIDVRMKRSSTFGTDSENHAAELGGLPKMNWDKMSTSKRNPVVKCCQPKHPPKRSMKKSLWN